MHARLTRLLRKHYPVIVFILVFLFIFRKVFLNGLYPYPGDLLVSFFFPYSGGGWEGYREFITHKEFIASDVVRQIYPWRMLAMDLLRNGELPLWNPYAFSGTPLLANLQSAVFYPVNILFFIFGDKLAWIMYILLQPVLACWFMYVFLRSLNLERLSALFAGIAYGFIGYVMIWFELGVVGHTAVWLPLSLFGITRFSDTKRLSYLLVSVIALACSLLAGHVQTAVYILIVTAFYYVFVTWKRFSWQKTFLYCSVLLLAFGLAAIQLVPSFELLQLSARNAETSAEVFYRMQLPFSHFALLFAPDFFGNPATNNFWGIDYNEFLSFVGVTALVFSCIGIFHYVGDRVVRFFLGVGLLALLLALPTPLSGALQLFQVPVLGTGIPARSLFLFEFSLVVLSGYGVQAVIQRKKISFLPIMIVGIIYIFLWMIVLFHSFYNSDTQLISHLTVSKRNLILPTATFLTVSLLLFALRFRVALSYLVLFLCIGLAAFEYSYQFYKYLPFSPGTYMFPSHPLVNYLRDQTPPDRVYGYDTARFETNFPTEWRVFSPEGYDPLYIRRYGELMHSAHTLASTRLVPRSDASFEHSLPIVDSREKRMLLNMLGVKYAVDKNDLFRSEWEPETDRFPSERFELIWQEGKWKVYENKEVLPRASVYYDWSIEYDDSRSLAILFDEFPYRTELLLSEQPSFVASGSSEITPAVITSYSAGSVTITADAKADGMLLITDAWYPGWNAYVDGRKEKVYQANYALRAVPLRKGTHEIIMKFEPMSFTIGAGITAFSLILLFGLFLYDRRLSRNVYAKKHTKK